VKAFSPEFCKPYVGGPAPARAKDKNMRAQVVLAFVGAAICLPPIAPIVLQDEAPIEQGIKLVNQGNVDRGIEVLRNHLKGHRDDVNARIVLGRILDFDGRPDEAVMVWEAGVSNTAADFPLLMSIGEIRHRQGTDGPTISYRRGMVQANPSKNEAEEERYKTSHLAQAATTLERARKLRPSAPEAASALASVYAEQGKHDAAAEVWKSLVKLEPKNGEFEKNLGLATKLAGRADEAAQYLKHAIELSPRLADAHEALAEIQKAKGQAAEAEQSRKRSEFYKRLPSFCTLIYSDENAKTLDSLDDAKAVRKLIDDPSDRATEFLAVVCWSHPHNQLESQAFESLEARGARTTPILRRLLEGAHSTCTIKSAGHILARRKSDGLFDHLVRLLPGDTRSFGMDMDIAGSLDDLGDARAVESLVLMLNPADTDPKHDPGPGLLDDRYSARARAALALGAFNKDAARRALEDGTKIPQFEAYCWAALYRLSKDPKHLAALEKAVRPGDGFTSSVVGNYLQQKVATKDAKELAQKWQRQREADRAADEVKAKLDASANKK
jgi:Flp pilus assembly protein TadD